MIHGWLFKATSVFIATLQLLFEICLERCKVYPFGPWSCYTICSWCGLPPPTWAVGGTSATRSWVGMRVMTKMKIKRLYLWLVSMDQGEWICLVYYLLSVSLSLSLSLFPHTHTHTHTQRRHCGRAPIQHRRASMLSLSWYPTILWKQPLWYVQITTQSHSVCIFSLAHSPHTASGAATMVKVSMATLILTMTVFSFLF